ncbi:MAG: DoxX family membrane protein [Rhizobiales bacterium]|nr:DoxX family membrane protein [Hyphomicrobiales bacterium]
MLSCTDRLAIASQDFLILCGRVMLGWIFVESGWGKLMNLPAFAKGLAPVPSVLGYIAAPVEFVGGVCILLGLATRYAALAILAFTIVATLMRHRYWEFTGAQYRAQSGQFWKNVSIMGGQLLLLVTAGGRYSIDALLRRR